MIKEPAEQGDSLLNSTAFMIVGAVCGVILLVVFILMVMTSRPTVYTNPSKIAEHVCMHSHGSFPSWLEIEALKPYLLDSEFEAGLAIKEEILLHLSDDLAAKRFAISQFVRENAQCHLRKEQNLEPDRRYYEFQQVLPDVPAIKSLETTNRGEWLKALNAAYTGEVITMDTSIVLRVLDDNKWYIESQIKKNYALPLEASKQKETYQKAVNSHRYYHAYQLGMAMCATPVGCPSDLAEVKVQWDRASEALKYPLHITEQRWINLAATPRRTYRVLEMGITNRSDKTVVGLMLESVNEGHTCLVQDKLSLTEDSPLTLRPKEEAKGYCRMPIKDGDVAVLDVIFADDP